MKKKVRAWIQKGKDPRSAHWQAALEAMLKLLKPELVPGRLVPVGALTDEDSVLFEKALAVVDLSPRVSAVFLPPDLAAKLTPPDTAEELHRIDKGKPSCRIIASRPGKETRLLCAEISAHARRPGVDIFQAGAYLGNYDFDNQEDCLSHLNKIIRAHIWETGNWDAKDHLAYTLHWFEKVCALDSDTVAVEKEFSFFHSPTLIKGDEMDALFTLLTEDLLKRGKMVEDPFGSAVMSMGKTGAAAPDLLVRIIEDGMVAHLNRIRALNLVNFSEFSNARSEQFKRGFAETVRYLENRLGKV